MCACHTKSQTTTNCNISTSQTNLRHMRHGHGPQPQRAREAHRESSGRAAAARRRTRGTSAHTGDAPTALHADRRASAHLIWYLSSSRPLLTPRSQALHWCSLSPPDSPLTSNHAHLAVSHCTLWAEDDSNLSSLSTAAHARTHCSPYILAHIMARPVLLRRQSSSLGALSSLAVRSHQRAPSVQPPHSSHTAAAADVAAQVRALTA